MTQLISFALVHPNAKLPTRTTTISAGYDVYTPESVTLFPGRVARVPLGLRVFMPEDFEIQVRPRSGLALKEQITVLNAPGTIDADYADELAVLLILHADSGPVQLVAGTRIAQFVPQKLTPVEVTVMDAAQLAAAHLQRNSTRNGGFGSTGR